MQERNDMIINVQQPNSFNVLVRAMCLIRQCNRATKRCKQSKTFTRSVLETIFLRDWIGHQSIITKLRSGFFTTIVHFTNLNSQKCTPPISSWLCFLGMRKNEMDTDARARDEERQSYYLRFCKKVEKDGRCPDSSLERDGRSGV